MILCLERPITPFLPMFIHTLQIFVHVFLVMSNITTVECLQDQ